MATGGKREGSGRKPIPRTRIMIHDDTLKELSKVEGKTWNEKIEKLLKQV